MGTACLWRKTWKRRGVACRRTPIKGSPTNSMCTIDRHDVTESDVMSSIKCQNAGLLFAPCYRASQDESIVRPSTNHLCHLQAAFKVLFSTLKNSRQQPHVISYGVRIYSRRI